MTETLEVSLFIFVLASFLGYAVITRVPGAAAHAPDVAHQRPVGDLDRGVAHPRRRRRSGVRDHPWDDRRLRVDDEHRLRLPHHGPDAEDVQAA